MEFKAGQIGSVIQNGLRTTHNNVNLTEATFSASCDKLRAWYTRQVL